MTWTNLSCLRAAEKLLYSTSRGSLFRHSLAGRHREPTSGLEPLTSSLYECAGSSCNGLHRLANTAFLSGFLCSKLLRVAPYCVRGGIRVVSTETELLHNTAHSRTHPKHAQHLADHAFIQLTLVCYSHWMPQLGRSS